MAPLPTKDVMIDIETLGPQPRGTILSIGAVEFNPDGEIGDTFYVRVNWENQGREIGRDTLAWWLTQDNDIMREQMTGEGRISLKEALLQLESFIGGPAYIWANGASFDLGILRHAYECEAIKCPWSFRFETCMRTLRRFVPWEPGMVQNDKKHDALADAIAQARYVIAARKIMYIPPGNAVAAHG